MIFSYEKDLENDIPKEDMEPDISRFYEEDKRKLCRVFFESFGLLNEKQIRKVVEKLENARKIYIFGIGSPGLIAKEFQQRFIRHRTPDGGSDRCAVNADVCGRLQMKKHW